MPTGTSTIGLLTLPLDAGAPDTEIPDPLLDGVILFVRTVLTADLGAKLGNLGPSSSAVAAAYKWNPLTRPQHFFLLAAGDGAALQFPALFCWRESEKDGDYSTLMGQREVTLKLCWMMSGPRGEGLVVPAGMTSRSGIFGAVSGSIMAAFDHGYHPQHAAGQSISVLLGLCGDGIWHTGAQFSILAPVPAVGAGGQEQAVTRGYPCITVTLTAQEGIGQYQPADNEQGQDLPVDIGLMDDEGLLNAAPAWSTIAPAPPYEGEQPT